MSKESMRFKPHFNSATGKYHGDKQDYLDTIKKMNLVPYEKPKEKKAAEYKPSAWARGMVTQIKRGNVGDVFVKELEKKGFDVEKFKAARDTARKMGASGNKGSFGRDY